MKIRHYLVAATAVLGAATAVSVPVVGADPVQGPPQVAGGIEGVRQFTVSWLAPTSGSPTSYTAKISGPGDPSPSVFTSVTSPFLVTTDQSAALKNGTSYSVTICAEYPTLGQVRNGHLAAHTVNTEVCANPFFAQTYPVPPPPINVSAVPGDRRAVLSWTPGVVDAVRHGAVRSHGAVAITYKATAQPGGKTCTYTAQVAQPRGPQPHQAQPQCTLTGLTNGVQYSATVVETDRVGASLASDATTFVPFGRPAAATGLGATPTTTSLAVHWNAAANNGRAVRQYVVTATPGSHSCTVGSIPNLVRHPRVPNLATTCTLSGLMPGTMYHLSVVATNQAGAGAAATASATTLSTAGSATVGPFTNDGQTLSPALLAKISAAAHQLATLGVTSASVVGYTDGYGTASSNQALSLSRANAVAAALQADLKALGHAHVALMTKGAGATNFIGGNPANPNNRRVIISWK